MKSVLKRIKKSLVVNCKNLIRNWKKKLQFLEDSWAGSVGHKYK